ncbi:MAG TPA: hypothetical protein VII38_10970 [Polyangia bacterium]
MKTALLATLLVFSEGVAVAHGGLPVTQRILRQGGGDTLYVPVVYWGVWVGGPGQPWKWICEEEINTNRNRRMVLSTDGTFYTTDIRGLTISTDKGCTWKPFAGELASHLVTDLAIDPTDGATAYATSGDSGVQNPDGGSAPPDNALWVTHDHGATFARAPGLSALAGRMFQSVRVAGPESPTAQTIYVTSVEPGATFDPELHRSTDGGQTFTTTPITYTLDGIVPHAVEVMAIDPRDPQVIYVRAFMNAIADGGEIAKQALLRSIDGGATFAELLNQDGVLTPSGQSHGIDDVAIDTTRGRVLVATSKGLLTGADPGDAPALTLAPMSSLSTAQCVDVHKGSVYACSSDYMPDFAALAESDDGAQSFHSILNYVDTVGPVDCPAGTPVGDTCPLYWEMYGSQLGISFTDGGMPISDGGMEPPHPKSGCGCQLGGASRGGSPAALAFIGLALLLMLAARSAGRKGPPYDSNSHDSAGRKGPPYDSNSRES